MIRANRGALLNVKRPTRTTILKESEEFRFRLSEIELRPVQSRFLALFDRSARCVLDMGHDLDEVEMIRWFLCSFTDGRKLRAVADPLSDRFRLIEAVRAATGAESPNEIMVEELEVETILEVRQ